MPTSKSIHELFAELPRECATWAIKIGNPVEVRYSDSLPHLWAVMEPIARRSVPMWKSWAVAAATAVSSVLAK